MKFSAVLAAVVSTAMAAPARTADSGIIAITNKYSFELSLSDFIEKRDARDPASLDWSSNACSFSPDNPLGFPFEDGCRRHDFGYRNFKKQNRFDDKNKAQIDLTFYSDLKNQCEGQDLEPICRLLAKVYYETVKKFGRIGSSLSKRDALDDAVAAYEQAFRDAQADGSIPSDLNP